MRIRKSEISCNNRGKSAQTLKEKKLDSCYDLFSRVTQQ